MIFNLTNDHIKLIQRMYVEWSHDEYGAPSIDPKRPYGNSDVEYDIAEILGYEENEDGEYEEEILEYCQEIHKETQYALQVILGKKTFKVGTYKLEDEYDMTSWRKIK